MSNIVKQGQSFLDKVIQLTGSYENALAFSILNNISITDNPEVGVKFKAGNVTNKKVTSLFHKNSEPATELLPNTFVPVDELGIGSMAIGSTFIIR